jgi:Putative Actinobacterial Holin-X, holin superfamily III
MPSEAAQNGIRHAAREVSQHALALTKLEAKLAKLELAAKARLFAPAAIFGVAALALALYAFGFALAAGAVGLHEVLPLWAALLVVAALLAVAVGILSALAIGSKRRASPAVPEATIAEAKETTRAIQEASR